MREGVVSKSLLGQSPYGDVHVFLPGSNDMVVEGGVVLESKGLIPIYSWTNRKPRTISVMRPKGKQERQCTCLAKCICGRTLGTTSPSTCPMHTSPSIFILSKLCPSCQVYFWAQILKSLISGTGAIKYECVKSIIRTSPWRRQMFRGAQSPCSTPAARSIPLSSSASAGSDY